MSHFPIRDKVVLEEVIVLQFDGLVIFNEAGIATEKSRYFHVIIESFSSSILTENLYFHEVKLVRIIFHVTSQDVFQV
jgi:hypothetical protein